MRMCRLPRAGADVRAGKQRPGAGAAAARAGRAGRDRGRRGGGGGSLRQSRRHGVQQVTVLRGWRGSRVACLPAQCGAPVCP